EPHTVQYAPASTLDLLPTIFHLAEARLPADRAIDGRNIAPLLNPERFAGAVGRFRLAYSGPDNSVFAFREGPWKIHVRLTSQLEPDHGFQASREAPLLFQLEHDVSERFDRSGENPEIVRSLLDALSDFEESVRRDGSFWND